MKILILGGTGFVGSNLASYLSAFHTVLTASRTVSGTNKHFDLGDPETYTICKDGYDVIINCIVDYSHSVEGTIAKELLPKKKFLEFISTLHIHYIEISSVSALEENKYTSDYNFSKFLSEEVLRFTLKSHPFDFSLLRFAQIIDANGGSRKSQKAYHYFADAFRNKTPLNVFGNPNVPRSYMPIAILVQTVKYGIEAKIRGFHNVIMPDSYCANDLVAAFRETIAKPQSEIIYDATGLAAEYFIPPCSESFVPLLAGFSCKEVFKKSLLDGEI